MRHTISGLVAAIAVVTASAAPAMACGWSSPCAQAYVPAYTYGGCNTGCGGWGYERLPDPVEQYHSAAVARPQYYYVDQGPTYTGPGNFAPYPAYREGGVATARTTATVTVTARLTTTAIAGTCCAAITDRRSEPDRF
jgi:hypothetical protein